MLSIGCGPAHYAPTGLQVYNYGLEGSRHGEQTGMKEFLKPYADSVNHTMNIWLAQLDSPLTKNWPECSLGHFMTDAYLTMAAQKFGKPVDVACMNYGGIRLNAISPGPITKGKIYELMPFDNLMVLIDLNGAQLLSFLNHVAARGGWPVSGAQYTITNRKATDVMVGGKPVDTTRMYTLATSDYVANGGDDSNVLRGLEQQNIGYLQRDAIIAYAQSFGSRNKGIEKPAGVRVLKTDE